MMPRADRRWILVIAGLLIVITAARVAVNDSRLGLALLSIVPILIGAYCFAMRGAIATASAATVLFVAGTRDLEADALAVAALTRGLVFFGTGVLMAELLRRAAAQATLIAEQRGEISELRVLREALTPSIVPETPGLEVGTAHVAAEGQAAGDFFLVMPGEDGRTLLALGDAVGHGIGPARRAAYVRAVLATLASSSQEPARLLELANTALLETDPSGVDFITAVCASFDGDRLHWASAGHPPPWDLDSGEALPGIPPRPPLGVRRDSRYETSTERVGAGRGVLLFSDGLPEARNPESQGGHELLGEAAVRSELIAHRGQAPAALVRALAETVRAFSGGTLADDLCLVAARRV